jgi:transposase
MSRGKELSADVCEIVVQLKQHFDAEKKSGPSVATKDSIARAAVALGIGVATVKRIVARYNRTGTVIPGPRRRPGRKPDESCESLQVIVRDFIRSQNLTGKRVSVEKVCCHLRDDHDFDVEKSTLWRALNRWGFTFGAGRRRDSLKEKDYVIHARRAYLREIRANRTAEGKCIRPEVYLDETFINKNHSQRRTWYADEDGPWVNKPSGVGPRLIVVHAISHTGWVGGAQLVFEAKKRTGDYHGQMNWENFSTWFGNRLLPNIPENSLIIMDNDGYHNVFVDERFPRASSTMEELRAWLSRNVHPWRDDMLKSELYDECAKHAPMPEFKLDILAAKHGHKILRTPPYHCDLQPIETCWAVVKNHMADTCDFTMSGLRKNLPDAFAKVTAETATRVIAKVREKEDRYWLDDAILDASFSRDCDEEELSSMTDG